MALVAAAALAHSTPRAMVIDHRALGVASSATGLESLAALAAESSARGGDEAKAARVCEGGTRLPAKATYCWMRKPGSKEWEGEWRSGTSKDAPKEMGAESMLYSLVNIDAPAAAPASAEGFDMKALVNVAGEMAGMEGAGEMLDAAQQRTRSNASRMAVATLLATPSAQRSTCEMKSCVQESGRRS